ncbi:MAG TPA: signal recognition particle-docking protein FtsY, partial [bacterium]|nr:signal recognition particle-docking protein FtsY [bacterium]
TAGRLHTKVNLMEELKKVRRVLDKAMAGAPHEVILVVDATQGQNALNQAREFHQALGLTGLILTKLDGTAKGGIVVGILDEIGVPIRYVGVGERLEDLKPFFATEFVDALLA